ncbi:peptidylprolyl isomerase [Brenneria populi subsp. brevivirga]|uniref:peptidylprolyl isomerase n=1 Tax=Brenneria populi TaxID=1505588 RepID=UPI002E17D466|nr:peptidylprolyl isomerase [Brenneria populi subsp. brevivirga]
MDTTLFARLRGNKNVYVVAALLLPLVLIAALWLDGGDKPAQGADVRRVSAAQAEQSQPDRGQESQRRTEEKPVASLGGLTVTRAEIEGWLAAQPESARQAMAGDSAEREQWLRRHLQEKALLAEARDKGWDKRPEVAAAMAAAERQVLMRSYLDSVSRPAADYPSPQQLNAAYEAAKDRLAIPARYHLRQIFLAAPANDAAAEAAVAKLAGELAEKARDGKEAFEQLANQYSQDAQSVARGGDIGALPLQSLLPEIRPAVTALQPGEVSAPIRSPSGFHIIKLEEALPSRSATLEEVAPRLTALLRQQRQAEQAQTHLNNLLGASPLTIDGPALQRLLSGAPVSDTRETARNAR